MVNISVRQLRYFLALSRASSFSRAAERGGFTQSTLSAAIQALERTLGTPLVDRAARGVKLTEAGKALAARADKIIADIEELPAVVSDTMRPLTSHLRLGVIPSIAPFLLPKALPSIRKAFPALRISLREALTKALLADVGAGNLDAAVIALPYPLKGFEVAELWEDQFFVAVGGDHRLANRDTVSSDDLKDERILLLENGHCLRDQVIASTGIIAPEDADELRATSLATLVQMADNDLGVTFLPAMAIAAGVTRGTRLKLLNYQGHSSSRTLVLTWRAGASRRGDYSILADHLRAQYLPSARHS